MGFLGQRWILRGEETAPATAQLDYEEGAGAIEFGLYERLEGETAYTVGVAYLNSATGMITFPTDRDEAFFERFCETVKLMEIAPPDEREIAS